MVRNLPEDGVVDHRLVLAIPPVLDLRGKILR